MSRIDSLQGVTRDTFLFACLRGSKRKIQGPSQKHNFHAYPRFSSTSRKRCCRIWRNYPEFLNFITKKEEIFWSKSCTCAVVLAKNVKWKASTKEYLLVIPVTFTQFLSASERDLMIDIQKLNNTRRIDILGRFVTSVSDEGKIVLRGTWRMTVDSVNKWQALSNLPSSGTHPNSQGIRPTAAPAEGLAPGPWFNQCPARGEAKQATKLPSSFPSSCHQCSLLVSPGEAVPRPPPGPFEDERDSVWGEGWPGGGELDETMVVLFELLITAFKADLVSCFPFCVWIIKICTPIKGPQGDQTNI